jgi:hypothetical protein
LLSLIYNMPASCRLVPYVTCCNALQFKCMLPGFFSLTHCVRQCPITGKKKGKSLSESRKFLDSAGNLSIHSKEPSDTSWLRNQAITAALSLQTVCTSSTCMLLLSCRQQSIAISRFQHAILPGHELLSPSYTNALLTNPKNRQALLLLRLRVTAKSRLLAARVRTSCWQPPVRSGQKSSHAGSHLPVSKDPLTHWARAERSETHIEVLDTPRGVLDTLSDTFSSKRRFSVISKSKKKPAWADQALHRHYGCHCADKGEITNTTNSTKSFL